MDVRSPILIVVNPTSGRGKGLRCAEAVACHLRTLGVDAEIAHTSGTGDAERIAAAAAARQVDRPACVVACGGDGTIQEIANALASARAKQGDDAPLLGLARAGRCNDFARALSMPKDPVGIANTLAKGASRPVDLGRVNGRYFCTVATLGIDAAVSSFVDTMRMPLKGTIAYLYGAVRVLLKYKPCRLRIDGPFGTLDQHVFLASSANTSSYGGAIPIAPDASPSDGLLDVCVISAISKIKAMWVIPMVMMGRHRNLRCVAIHRTANLSIEADTPLDMWADGEPIATTPATIDIVPGAIRVIMPQ